MIVHFKPKSEAEDETEPTIPKVDGAIHKPGPLYSEIDYSEETIEQNEREMVRSPFQ